MMLTKLPCSYCLPHTAGKPFDPTGTAESVDYVRTLIEQEVAAGIPPERIVVGGFSQGGHIAYKTVLTHPVPLAGCAALSTWLEPSLKDVSGRSSE